jgi:hypothetical protein
MRRLERRFELWSLVSKKLDGLEKQKLITYLGSTFQFINLNLVTFEDKKDTEEEDQQQLHRGLSIRRAEEYGTDQGSNQ